MTLFWVKYMDGNGTVLSAIVPTDTKESAVEVIKEQMPGVHIFNVQEHVPKIGYKM